MLTYNMHFEITTYSDSVSGMHYAEDYSFWNPLIEYFLSGMDAFEIHCWEDEQAVVDEIINELSSAECRKEGKVIIVKGELTDKAKNFLLANPLNDAGQLKWFSVFLHRNGNILFSSEHYGTEFTGSGLNVEQKEFVIRTLPEDISVLEW
ncbi:hypothetical protein [Planococcus halotolerans]|uniref:Uncharacterized protein n=1 Tax=Planococcus halotolerans TaxID=2233542 RepID=A0A365L256_9BACL|nr:hypothetical protein [Planococcus halotolerans]QHJ70962.1 hypothetical protein DNR44_010230 [Planococcus halotolerans]RAZ79275.1 hypothetical protein DP120_06570 [Planococcus halotolerans]